MRGVRIAVVALFTVAAGGVACAPDPGGDGGPAAGRLHVVAGFYPLQFVAEQVGGDRVDVTNLAQPGAEPHDLELSPQQVAAVADADIVVYVPGFQPELDDAVAGHQPAAFDSLAFVAPLGDGTDPHFWLDPSRLATVAAALAGRLGELDPSGKDEYERAAQGLGDRLNALDGEYATTLATCQRREIVVSHAAFAYLADRYRLDQIAITGLSPEVEPTPQRLAAVAAAAREHGATTIFFETLVDPGVAETLATEVGARTAVLDPIEGLPPGSTGDYLSVMRANLATLTEALGCA